MNGILFDTGECEKTATLSDCGFYRYVLGRHWGEGDRGIINWVMLNPSKADASEDDPTIKKCIGFSKRWGYSGLIVTNLFALRSTDPKAMKRHPSPIGPENDDWIRRIAYAADDVICAWGANGDHANRDAAVLSNLRSITNRIHRIAPTKGGHPGHPLMLGYSTPLERWETH